MAAIAYDILTRIIRIVRSLPGEQAVLATAVYSDFGATVGPYSTTRSANGQAWTAAFGNNTGTAASGLGFTVIGRGGELNDANGLFVGSTATRVAFGTPRDGASCFIAVVGGTDIKRGILNDAGQLVFSSVAAIAEGTAFSCTFAGGAFFISYGIQDVHTFLAVSFDGINFTMGVNAFPNVQDYNQGTGYTDEPNAQPAGGNVAYDKNKNVYVTTGFYVRNYVVGEPPTETTSFERNFMAATSSNGITWAATYDISENAAGIAGPRFTNSSVCFAKGKFWAITGVKSASVGAASYRCGFAHSTNGTVWTNVQLPNAVAEGYSSCIRFFKAKAISDDEGFFVIGGIEIGLTKLWYSANGTNWTHIRADSAARHWALSAVGKKVDPGDPAQKFFYL